jgi:hypothetical protein
LATLGDAMQIGSFLLFGIAQGTITQAEQGKDSHVSPSLVLSR